MQFSVIIPAYNSESFLERSIKSVLFQSFKDYELIIVNDGSVDHTEEIAKSFSSKYACVKYVEKKMVDYRQQEMLE
ncbi:glycosyltransferase [Lactobacillus helveticus]